MWDTLFILLLWRLITIRKVSVIQESLFERCTGLLPSCSMRRTEIQRLGSPKQGRDSSTVVLEDHFQTVHWLRKAESLGDSH